MTKETQPQSGGAIWDDTVESIFMHRIVTVRSVMTSEKRVFKRDVTNDRETIPLVFLSHEAQSSRGLSWSPFVTGTTLIKEGYTVHPTHPRALKQYAGLKHLDDTHDVFQARPTRILKGIPTKGSHLPGKGAPVIAYGLPPYLFKSSLFLSLLGV